MQLYYTRTAGAAGPLVLECGGSVPLSFFKTFLSFLSFLSFCLFVFLVFRLTFFHPSPPSSPFSSSNHLQLLVSLRYRKRRGGGMGLLL